MARALALAALLAAAGSAGCLGPALQPSSLPPGGLEPLTEAVFEIGAFLPLQIPMRDGVNIHVDLVVPAGDGPFAALLELTPYALLGRDRWGLAQEYRIPDPGAANSLVDFYVPRGYAVAVAHVRGTGESGGCLTVGGPDEGLDGAELVQWLAAQPWSNGKVAMLGTSYVGTTPLQTAILAPPNLTTIVPVSAVTAWYDYYFERGAHRANGSPPPGSSHTDAALWAAMGIAPGPRDLATGGADDVTCQLEFAREDLGQDDDDAYWQERNIRAHAGDITASVLYAQGFDDLNVATTMVPEFWSGVGAEKRMWLAQHGHGVPASRESYHEFVHRWLDHFLLGKANGALDLAPVLVEDNLGGWRTEATWPPLDANATKLWLAPGALAAEPPAEAEGSWLDDGLGREDAALEGANHLRFLGEPLAQDLHVAGAPVVHLEAAANLPDTNFVVHFYDVAPDGAQAFLTRGFLDARHRESLEQGKDLRPGQRAAFEFPLHPQDYRVQAGHRLELVLKSSDPYILPDAERAMVTAFFGADGSWIAVPGIARASFLEDAPVPG
ncbi:MAG TPA: CocE/NonD family hydrolase [Candidatus Thermoplasmatota archaeon]|jgi:X-Pro dipeptidyl-peptidase|nr:CocE/NonD family hydrolase [Candidatus Thermoplasmatota archaeon]